LPDRLASTFPARGDGYVAPARLRATGVAKTRQFAPPHLVAYCLAALGLPRSSAAWRISPIINRIEETLRRAVPSFTVEIRRRPRLATMLSPRAPSFETRSPRAEFDRESHRDPPAGLVAKEVDPSPVEVAPAPTGRILPSLVCDEPLRPPLREAAPTQAESAPPSRAPKRPSARPSQRKNQATKLPQDSSVPAHESQPVAAEQLTASHRMSPVQSDEGAGPSPRGQTRAPNQVGGDSPDLALSAKAKRIDKIATSRDDVRAKPLHDEQRSTTRADSPAAPESRKRTIVARYVFGEALGPGELWKRRLLRSR
jgi:hypothetical protein